MDNNHVRVTEREKRITKAGMFQSFHIHNITPIQQGLQSTLTSYMQEISPAGAKCRAECS